MIKGTRAAVMLVVALLTPTLLHAQDVLDPQTVEFAPSSDHNATGTNGPLVSRYDLNFYLVGAAQPFQTVSLSKPTPASDGKIRVPLSQISSLPSPGIVYESRVAAVGPGGTSASAVSNTFMFSVPCTFAATPLTSTIAAAAGGGNVAVTSTAGCAWAASSNSAWLSVTAGASGTGNGSVTFAATANPAASARVGSLTVAGLTITITQSAAPCSFGLSPATQSTPVNGGTGSLSVTVANGCSWTASSNATWLRITGGGTGSGNGTVALTADPNASSVARSATVSVGGQSALVTQVGAACTFGVTPTSQSVAAAGGSGTLAVTSPGGCNWTASSGAAWVTISNGATGAGNGSVAFSVTANTLATPRSATLTVAGQPITISQAAAACTFGVTPTSQSAAAAGGTGTLAVTSLSGCNWTASSAAAWVTISNGATGSGNGAVDFNVAVNALTTARSTTLTVAGVAVTISQAAAPCTFGVTPTSQSLAATGGSGTLAVTSPGGCNWTASSAAAWVTISSGSNGSGNGAVGFNVAANPVATPRSATLTVAGQAITISQAAAACTFGVTPTSQSVAAAGGNGSLSVTSPGGCNWTAASGAAWVTISSGATGTANGAVAFSVAANTLTTPRSATLTVAGQAITINQVAAACTFGVTPTSQSIVAAGGTGTLAVTSSSGCNWTASSGAAWVTISNGSTGSGNGAVDFSVPANTLTTARSTTLTVAGVAVTISQAAAPCTFGVTPTSQSVAATGGSGTLAITSPAGCNWTAASAAAWVTISSGATGSGNGAVAFNVAANPVATPRSLTLTVAGQAITISQAAAACTFGVTPTSQSVAAAGGNGSLSVTSPGGCDWTSASGAPWVTITNGATGTGNGSVAFSVGANALTTSRSATLTVAGQAITVSQVGIACTFGLTPTTQAVAVDGGDITVAVATAGSCTWTASSGASWLRITGGGTGTGNGTVALTADPNPTSLSRSGSITVGGQSATVTQVGIPCTFGVTPTAASMAAAGGTGTLAVTSGGGCSWTAVSGAPWVTVTTGATGTGDGPVGFTVSPNASTSPRAATLTVAGQAVAISQAGAACTFGVTPTTQSVPAAGGSGSVAVTSGGGCAWTAASGAPWVTISGSGNGSGNGSVAFTAAANTATSSRSATLTVAGQAVTVTQAGVACSFAVTPATQSLPQAGGTATGNVTTTAGCSWTATSPAGWLTITAGASVTGSGTFTMSAAPNTGSLSRSATLAVGGHGVLVNQSGNTCSFTVTPATQSVDNNNTTYAVSVAAGSGCAWTAQSNSPWVSITSATSGTGNGAVSFKATPNSTGASRTGTMTIGGQTVTVTQAVVGAPSAPTGFQIKVTGN